MRGPESLNNLRKATSQHTDVLNSLPHFKQFQDQPVAEHSLMCLQQHDLILVAGSHITDAKLTICCYNYRITEF